MESLTMAALERTDRQTPSVYIQTLHIVSAFYGIATLVYSCVKGAFVLSSILHDDSYQLMHMTYNALVISAAVFSVIEFGLIVLAGVFMRRLKVRKPLLHMNIQDILIIIYFLTHSHTTTPFDAPGKQVF